jgi:hypothetical protein
VAPGDPIGRDMLAAGRALTWAAMNENDAERILQLAHALGQRWVDEPTAKRIAAGAAPAIKAVQDSMTGSDDALLEIDAGTFLATLDSLAGSGL